MQPNSKLHSMTKYEVLSISSNIFYFFYSKVLTNSAISEESVAKPIQHNTIIVKEAIICVSMVSSFYGILLVRIQHHGVARAIVASNARQEHAPTS